MPSPRRRFAVLEALVIYLVVTLHYAKEQAPSRYALASGVHFLPSNQLPAMTQGQLAAQEKADRARDSGYLERALVSSERAKKTGVYFSADEVLSRLEARLFAAIAKRKT